MIKETIDSEGREILTIPYGYLRFKGEVGDEVFYNPYSGYCRVNPKFKPEYRIIEIEMKGLIFKKPSMVKLLKLN